MSEAKHAEMAGGGPETAGACGVYTALCILRSVHTLGLQKSPTDQGSHFQPVFTNLFQQAFVRIRSASTFRLRRVANPATGEDAGTGTLSERPYCFVTTLGFKAASTNDN